MKYVNDQGVEFNNYREFLLDKFMSRLDKYQPDEEVTPLPDTASDNAVCWIEVDYDNRILITYNKDGEKLAIYEMTNLQTLKDDIERLLRSNPT